MKESALREAVSREPQPPPQLSVRRLEEADSDLWDTFVERSWNGTFLHTRRFLTYHHERFDDASLLLEQDGRLVGVFPAAIDPEDEQAVLSHPGITFGGLVHDGQLKGSKMLNALLQIASWYQQHGFALLRYKSVPSIYHRSLAQADLYALFRLGAYRYRSDLAAVIDYRARRPSNTSRRHGVKKAQREQVCIKSDNVYLEAFWSLLSDHLNSRFKVKPTHSLSEISALLKLFPERLECVTALVHGCVVAGALLFHHPEVVHVQYMAANIRGREVAALDLLLQHCIDVGQAQGKHYFSFGISSEQAGRKLNHSLHWFKTGFGTGEVVHEFYQLVLAENEPLSDRGKKAAKQLLPASRVGDGWAPV